MEWVDEAIIIGMRKFAEHGAVVRVFSRRYGIYSGVCKHALSSKQRGVFQLGNVVEVSWYARLEDHLGTLSAELKTPVAALVMQDVAALQALGAACALCRNAFEERDAHPQLYDALHRLLLDMAVGEDWRADYVRFEMRLLAEAGFGLDVSACAATGQTEDLVYVSPRSGCAVSAEAGAPYREKLLPLPAFLVSPQKAGVVTHRLLCEGLQLTGYFLHHWLLEPLGRSLPAERERLTQWMIRRQEQEMA